MDNDNKIEKARDNHINWEKENGFNPYEDWGRERR